MSKIIDNALSALEKRFGEPVVMRMSDSNAGIKTFSTGRPDLDTALGGGWAVGKIIEIFAESGCGKTGLALEAIKSIQDEGGIAAIIDAENALNTDYCEQIGIDVSKLYISQPSYGEQAFQAIRALVNTGKVGLIVVDSVATLIPKAELEGETGEAKMGLQARMMGQGIRQITGITAENNCTVIFINQIRKSLAAYGNPNTTPGGKALPFAASQRVEIKNKGRVTEGDEVVGFKQHIKVIKNKVAPPFKFVDNEIRYGIGVDKLGGFIDALVFEEILIKKGAWISYDGTNIAQGMKKLRVMLEDNPELLEELEIKLSEIRK